MQKRSYSLTLLLLLIGFNVLAQGSTPAVPTQVTFADISVRFDADAQRIIQQDVNALLANRQYWTAKLDRVALYFPMIESILIDEDVPADFKYLAVQESSLTPDAVSSSSAVGYWQFKRETAIGNGLRVDDEIDERKSITGSTRGAARYLKKSNGQFNNWVASLYSYYLGATGITKLVPPDWSYARELTLDGRTDRYILRFFAHKIAIESALKFHQASNRFALIEYPSGGGKTIPAIAEELNVDEFELRKYNRWVLGETVPTDKAYVMAIPVLNDQINDIRQKIVSVSGRKTPNFVQNDVGFPVLRRVSGGSAGKNSPVLYEINGLPGIQAQAGDNAASLARKAKISLSSFLRYNDMSDSDPVITNDVYYLAKKRKKALVPFHTVREGETSRSISQRYALRLKKLMRFNRLDRIQKLAVGRVMWLRERRPSNKPVEIINSPTAPVYDQTPSPSVADVVAATSPERSASRSVTGSDDIPRKPSERKLYQPKLVGGGVTPNDGTSEPATVQRTEPARPARQSAPVTRPSAGGSASTDADGSQRVVIVRSTETDPSASPAEPVSRPKTATTRPLYPPAAAQSSGRESTASEPTLVMDEPTRSQPAKASSDVNQPTIERGRYDGPREQQADGSLTVPAKAPPRPAAPAVIKSESRERPAEVAVTEPKGSTPAGSRSTATVSTPVDRSATSHTVEPGQTYYSISRQYGLTVDELLTLNNRTTNDVLATGQKLTVKATAATKPAQSAETTSTGVSYHTVAKGETMFRISKIYDVTIEQIQEWNNLTDVGVKEGQKIKIVK
ncbi:LysM peptidoglycan-binding domain-containing protein [Spirosoma utsteinense]|uniref:Membrane-bound lytic murein transglycosylase D n=1 Tax=Spirosoma utsteinense TaxID=2585773 RepID=A0ABR6WAC8_9BACT|nr:lytic transglycosylase domain-containing protein [Spirosoma utsteinense]MBC3783997.1 membrane-bound lytic murein transglycosylase D [Spirosoma utsteinense]MBC3793515.1 membrane-bound lytic murein transglycosylase D [Spirosoma utsteinense]